MSHPRQESPATSERPAADSAAEPTDSGAEEGAGASPLGTAEAPIRSPSPLLHRIPKRLRLLLASRARTWALMVPLHLAAFLILYFATANLLESEIVSVASDTAAERLDLAARDLAEATAAHALNPRFRHVFEVVAATHEDIAFQLLLPDGSVIGPGRGLTQAEHEAMRSFLFSDESRRIWLSEEEDRQAIRGVEKVIAEPRCADCHEQGATLAVASMRVDLTTILGRIRDHSRRNLALLIIAWAGLLGLTTALVRRSAQRSARRLEADLAAAEAGADSDTSTAELVLDPAAAELHESLRRLLRRQREHQAEVASRLAHTDQLASLGRLAAGLAHEIKNPLAGIHGALEILRKDSGDPSTGMLYDDMLEELKRVNHTLQLLLESARPRPPRLVPTDVARLIKEAVHLLRPGLTRQRTELRYEIAAGIRHASLDGAKIRQVLINLIQNAAEAMEGDGSILVRAGNFPNQEEGVILAVEDTGPGISEENQRKIFEPFFTTKFTGTGLGLAIARSLVEQHGGSLQVESEADKGSTFYVLLPGRVGAGEEESGEEGGD